MASGIPNPRDAIATIGTATPTGLLCLANAVRARDAVTAGRGLSQHETSVSCLVTLTAAIAGYGDAEAERIGQAAAVHDIGKLAIPDSILLHPGKLDAAAWEVLRSHPAVGAAILAGHDDPILDLAARIAAGHHEAFDGSGYPYGLIGEAIPLEARIASLCDVYDALRQDRPYKAGLCHEAVLELLEKGDDRLTPQKFDPEVLRGFLRNARHIEALWEESRGHGTPGDAGIIPTVTANPAASDCSLRTMLDDPAAALSATAA